MNPLLFAELLWRRYGWPVLLIPAACIALAGSTLFMRVVHPADTGVVLPTDAGRQLDTHHRAFLAVLIPRAELEARQREVLDAAARHNLVPGRVDYGYENNETGRFGIASLQLPLQGSYADLRAFLATVLAAQPALALRELNLRRTDDSRSIEARLCLDFHTLLLNEGAE
ncbi:MAG: hypothetical protein AB1443_04940 [Pseudomonadota bacterium]